jgi:hypothetical protein
MPADALSTTMPVGAGSQFPDLTGGVSWVAHEQLSKALAAERRRSRAC